MKFYLFILTLLLSHNVSLYSQVTIGSDAPPEEGALLDLKQNPDRSSRLGLAMPRGEIKDMSVLKINESDYSGSENEHIGLVIYNVYDDQCPNQPISEGLYIWGGSRCKVMIT